MVVAVYYALRSIRRRPKSFISLAGVSAAVMLVLILMLLFLEAEWRQSVMPDNIENYHLRFYDLSDKEKDWIKNQEWTQATYEVDSDVYNEEYTDEFRVRVTWDYAVEAAGVGDYIMDALDLWSREPYASRYKSYYNSYYNNIVASWYGMTEKNGLTADGQASYLAKVVVQRNYIRNRNFCIETSTSYLIRPENVIMTSLFTVFLGAAVVIMISARYKRFLSEYGSLCAIGFTRPQLWCVVLTETAAAVLTAIPVASLSAYIIAKLYSTVTAEVDLNGFYLTMLDYIPISNIALVSAELFIASMVGALFVCYKNRNLTTLDMLTARTEFTVSFVSKTSERFERAAGVGEYNRLTLVRTRRSVALDTLTVVLMTPLPLYYVFAIYMMTITTDMSSTDKLSLYYYIIQAAALVFISTAVIYLSAAYRVGGRKRELAVIRSLGASAHETRLITYPTELLRSAIATLLSVAVTVYVVTVMSRTLTVGAVNPIETKLAILQAAIFVIGDIAFIFAPTIVGTATGLHGVRGGNIISVIRETE